jgi:hypothetical protein
VGWKEYHNDVVHGSYNESTFNEVERAADYVILFTTNRGDANNFYLKITNVDIKWGYNRTNMNFLLNNGKWTMLNNKNDGNNRPPHSDYPNIYTNIHTLMIFKEVMKCHINLLVADQTTFCHQWALITGTITCPFNQSTYPNNVDPKLGRFIYINNTNNTSPYLTTWPVNSFNEFKIVASLKLGQNNLTFNYEYKPEFGSIEKANTNLTVRFHVNVSMDPLNLAIIVANNSNKTFDMDQESIALGESNNLTSAVKRLQTAAKLWQALTSDSLNSWGHGRKSFRLDLDNNQGFH